MEKKKAELRMAALLTAAALAFTPAFSMKSNAEQGKVGEVKRVWDFSDGTQGWTYDDSWAGDSYSGYGACDFDGEKGMLKVKLDYSGNKDNSWSETGICFTEEEGIDFSPYKVLNFDLYYDPAAFTMGQIIIKAFSDNVFRDQTCNINQVFAEDRGGLKVVNLSLMCDPNYAQREKPRRLLLQLIGSNTDYCGDIWLDNITLSSIKKEKFLVDSSVEPETETVLTDNGDSLTVNGSSHNYENSVPLADSKADPSVVAIYQYLKAVGESDSTLFGHMEDTVLKAGSSDLTNSDTMDVTGSLSAVVGFDCGSLFSGYSIKYNERHPGAELPDTNTGNVAAAALLSNEAIEEGAVITLSSHMPNFSASIKLDGTFENSYDQYDYSPADSYVLTGNCMNEILPGGLYNDSFRAYLDMIADYAKQVEGPVLFRPFHENTGSWFWWGKAFCDEQTYKSVFKYTVEYLRDEKDVHNLLYLYGPGSEATNVQEYEERYPGDEYVDVVGFDTYDSDPVPDEKGYTFQKSFENAVKLTDGFAKAHGKLFAVTETGITSSKGAGIPETGNQRPEWFTEILDILTKPEYDCCYFMLWSNYSRTGGYYTPFAEEVNEDGTLFGHELMNPFISFFNNEKSVFAADQAVIMKDIVAGKKKTAAVQGFGQVSGYITSPVSGSRILEETTLTARLNQEVPEAEFRILGNGQEITIAADVQGKQAEAQLDEEMLKKIGAAADGKISLYTADTKLQENTALFNIEPRAENPLSVDDFESYAGLNSLLVSSWALNKESSCELSVTLSDEFVHNGDYSMKFDYKETRNGWAGCEFLKETDWSGCNALQFWVKPDGNNQKTVVQIKTSDGGTYEAYLQECPEYAASVEGILVTLPFSEFMDKGGKGSLTSETAASVIGIGLWVNAIPDSEAMDSSGQVRGALYYDDIKAIQVRTSVPVFEGAAKGMADGTAAVKTDRKVSGKKYLIPLISGAAALLSAGGLVWQVLEQKKRR